MALFDGGSEPAKEQAAGALQTLVIDNVQNQLAIAYGLVSMLVNGSALAQEHATLVLRNLAQDPENRAAIAKAGAVPELVRQLESGSEKAMGMAASALGRIALQSEAHRATVTKELVKLLASEIEAVRQRASPARASPARVASKRRQQASEALRDMCHACIHIHMHIHTHMHAHIHVQVRQRASEALRDMAAEDKTGGGAKKGSSKKSNSATGGGAPLVNLLKDGLKDDNTEAQEYALWPLSSIARRPPPSCPSARTHHLLTHSLTPLTSDTHSGRSHRSPTWRPRRPSCRRAASSLSSPP